MSKSTYWRSSLISLGLVPLLLGCRSLLISSSTLVLDNQSGSTIRTVQVESAGSQFTAENLPSSSQQTWKLEPKQDASFTVVGKLATGEPISVKNVGYTTPGDTATHYLIIKPGGTVEYEAKR